MLIRAVLGGGGGGSPWGAVRGVLPPSRRHVFVSRRILSNSAAAAKKKFSGDNLSRLLGLWRPERARITAGIGLLVVSSGVTMSVPFALGKIIDLIYKIDQTTEKEEDAAAATLQFETRLKTVCLGLTGVFLVGGLCNFGRVYLMRVAGQRITKNLRSK